MPCSTSSAMQQRCHRMTPGAWCLGAASCSPSPAMTCKCPSSPRRGSQASPFHDKEQSLRRSSPLGLRSSWRAGGRGASARESTARTLAVSCWSPVQRPRYRKARSSSASTTPGEFIQVWQTTIRCTRCRGSCCITTIGSWFVKGGLTWCAPPDRGGGDHPAQGTDDAVQAGGRCLGPRRLAPELRTRATASRFHRGSLPDGGDRARDAGTFVATVDREAPTGVHFSGHGKPGALLFESNEGLGHVVPVREVIDALRRRLPDDRRLPPFFYLATCHGNDPARLEQHEPGSSSAAVQLHQAGVTEVVDSRYDRR